MLVVFDEPDFLFEPEVRPVFARGCTPSASTRVGVRPRISRGTTFGSYGWPRFRRTTTANAPTVKSASDEGSGTGTARC